ncbi:MAG TPA: ATP-binding protein [Bacteroidales bacterium]|nr:ATP-binding protein [Bacteroidales bacterium]
MTDSVSDNNGPVENGDTELRKRIRYLEDRLSQANSIIEEQKDFSILFNTSLHLLESVDKKTVLQRIVDSASKLVTTDTSAIYLVKEDELILRATYPPLPPGFPDEFRLARLENHPHIRRVIDEETIVIIPDTAREDFTDEENVIVKKRKLGSIVYIPLFVNKRVTGVIIIGTIKRRSKFEKHQVDLFRSFSNITSLALENTYLVKNLIETRDKAEENDRLKTAFLHNISHEIRTPLNAILGFSGMLTQKDLTKDQIQKYIDIIDKSGKQLMSIVDDIISISHIETRQLSVYESTVNLNALLINLELQYRTIASHKNLEFRAINFIQPPDKIILTDEFKLLGILTNLINNAIKFTDKGFIEVGVSEKNKTIEFYVLDSGIGIPESERSKIFDRFYQIDYGVNRTYDGMGLGLSISSAYSELLGGKITVESEAGKGSKFILQLPEARTGKENHSEIFTDRSAMM